VDGTSKVVTAAKGIKNVPAGGGLVGGGILNLQVREAERVLKRKLKELNQQVRLRNTPHREPAKTTTPDRTLSEKTPEPS
jgi:hypothetical protein